MAYEFKNMATVDVVESVADEATVLIEEGGVIKRAPKSEVGGSEKADLVISFNFTTIQSFTSENTSVSIESGSLDAVVEALRNGRSPIVKCKRFYVVSGFDTSVPFVEGGVYDCDIVYYNGMISISFAIPFQFMARIDMDIEDADYLQVWVHPLAMTTIQVI